MKTLSNGFLVGLMVVIIGLSAQSVCADATTDKIEHVAKDLAKFKHDLAARNLKQAEVDLNLAEADLVDAEVDIDQAENDLIEAEANDSQADFRPCK